MSNVPETMRFLLSFALAAAVSAAGCGARAPVVAGPPPPSPAVVADALLREGCFRCLEEAFATADAAGLHEQAFEAAILLVARSKELGLPHRRWVNEARMRVPAGSGWQKFVDIAAYIRLDPFSDDRDAVLTENAATNRPRAVLEQWRRELVAPPGSALLRAYLDVTLVCGPLLFEQREPAIDAALGAFGGTGLLQYRSGACGRLDMLHAAVRNPRFVETEFELGREALQRERADHVEALRRFGAARVAFPGSPTIASAVGTLRQQREEWEEALEAHDAALAVVPTHRDALLGRTISLSHLGRHADAIGAATQMIELGSWFIAEAYYWRAWNAYQTNDLAAARSDVDRSKAASLTAPTLVLSGVIAWREKRQEFAEEEFQAALNLDFGYCEASLNLGEVRAERRRWETSLAAFDHAQQCFGLAIEVARNAVEQLSATPEEATANARQIASHQRTIADSERRQRVAQERAAGIRKLTSATR